jgi:hypothetical protein
MVEEDTWLTQREISSILDDGDTYTGDDVHSSLFLNQPSHNSIISSQEVSDDEVESEGKEDLEFEPVLSEEHFEQKSSPPVVVRDHQ